MITAVLFTAESETPTKTYKTRVPVNPPEESLKLNVIGNAELAAWEHMLNRYDTEGRPKHQRPLFRTMRFTLETDE